VEEGKGEQPPFPSPEWLVHGRHFRTKKIRLAKKERKRGGKRRIESTRIIFCIAVFALPIHATLKGLTEREKEERRKSER